MRTPSERALTAELARTAENVRLLAPQVLYGQGRPALMERLKQIAPSARPLERHKILEAIEVAVREGGLTAAGDLPIDYLCAASRMHSSIHRALLGGEEQEHEEEEEGGGGATASAAGSAAGSAADGGEAAAAARSGEPNDGGVCGVGAVGGSGAGGVACGAAGVSDAVCVELEASAMAASAAAAEGDASSAGGAAGTSSSWLDELYGQLEPKRPRRDGAEVLRRRGAIGPDGCAALCAAVDAERSFLRDSVDQHAEHQLNCSKERLVELIGAEEASQLFRLPETLLATRRESRRCRRATAAAAQAVKAEAAGVVEAAEAEEISAAPAAPAADGAGSKDKVDDGCTDSSEDEDEEVRALEPTCWSVGAFASPALEVPLWKSRFGSRAPPPRLHAAWPSRMLDVAPLTSSPPPLRVCLC